MYCIEKIASLLGSLVTYILPFIFNPGHKWEEVTSGKLNTRLKKEKVLPQYYDICIAEDKELSLQQKERLSSNNDKCNTILNISSFLFAAQIAIITWKDNYLFLLFPTFLTACSIFLVLMRDRVGVVQYVSLKPLLDRHMTKKKIKKKIIEDFHCSLHHNNCVINFKTGIYSAARRILIISIFLTMLLMLVLTFFINESQGNGDEKPVNIFNIFISM